MYGLGDIMVRLLHYRLLAFGLIAGPIASVLVGGPNLYGQEPTGVKLPHDFSLVALTMATHPIDLTKLNTNYKKTKELMSLDVRAGNEAFVCLGRDAATGLRGKGLRIKQKDYGKIGRPELRTIWTPELFACYRDGKLLGVWDPSTKCLRAAETGEAEPTFRSPRSEKAASFLRMARELKDKEPEEARNYADKVIHLAPGTDMAKEAQEIIDSMK